MWILPEDAWVLPEDAGHQYVQNNLTELAVCKRVAAAASQLLATEGPADIPRSFKAAIGLLKKLLDILSDSKSFGGVLIPRPADS